MFVVRAATPLRGPADILPAEVADMSIAESMIRQAREKASARLVAPVVDAVLVNRLRTQCAFVITRLDYATGFGVLPSQRASA